MTVAKTTTKKKKGNRGPVAGISTINLPTLKNLIHKTVREAIFEALELRNIVVNEDYLTMSEVGERLRVSSDTIKKWVKEGCPHLRVVKQNRFRMAEVVDWLRRDSDSGTRPAESNLRKRIMEDTESARMAQDDDLLEDEGGDDE